VTGVIIDRTSEADPPEGLWLHLCAIDGKDKVCWDIRIQFLAEEHFPGRRQILQMQTLRELDFC
jgi:hypothetical protein